MGDALSERDWARIRIKALSLACPEPFGPELTAEGLGRREPLALHLRLRYRLASAP